MCLKAYKAQYELLKAHNVTPFEFESKVALLAPEEAVMDTLFYSLLKVLFKLSKTSHYGRMQVGPRARKSGYTTRPD